MKIHQKLNLLKPLKYKLSHYTLEVLYKSVVRSFLEYADIVWGGCSESDSSLLESLQIESARVVTGAMKGQVEIAIYAIFLGLNSVLDEKCINSA